MADPKITRVEIEATRIAGGARRNTVNSSPVIPIVFLPGVMGSRVKFTTRNAAWDPDNLVPGMLGWTRHTPERRALYLDPHRTPGKVMSNGFHTRDKDFVEVWKKVDPAQRKEFYGVERGWSGVSRFSYHKFLMKLEVEFNSGRYRAGQHPVYAFGYDWRQSNAISGAQLAAWLKGMLPKHGAKKAILMTHSMGGLVARAACRLSGIAPLLQGVVHVVQPVNGATIAYRRFAEGMALDEEDGPLGKPMGAIFGGTWWGYTMALSGSDGPVELLPNQVYKGWLINKDGRRQDCATIYDHYRQKLCTRPLPSMAEVLDRGGGYEEENKGGAVQWALSKGIGKQSAVDKLEAERMARFRRSWPTYLSRLSARIATARAFHGAVAEYAHPRTFMLYAKDGKTEVAYDWSKPFGKRGIEDALGGDGTVPIASAQGLDSIVSKFWKALNPPATPTHNLGAQSHADVFKGDGVPEEIYKRVRALIALRGG